MSTSYRKTLIYVVLPSLYNTIRGCQSSRVVVLSPLVALMAEQKRQFLPLGVSAEFLGKLHSDEDA